MRKTMLGCVCLLLTISLAFFACNKNSDVPAADIFTSHSWKIQSWIVTPGLRLGSKDTAYTDFSPKDACEKDDYVQFYTDATAEYNSGASHCASLEKQHVVGVWHFLNDGKRLFLQIPDVNNGYIFNHEYDIVTLEKGTFKISRTFFRSITIPGQTIQHTETITFVK
jgi:hypothetical protein